MISRNVENIIAKFVKCLPSTDRLDLCKGSCRLVQFAFQALALAGDQGLLALQCGQRDPARLQALGV